MQKNEIIISLTLIAISVAGMVAGPILGVNIITLLFVMVFSGILMGIMFNIALSKPVLDTGGVIGGAVVGLFMYILGGGFSL